MATKSESVSNQIYKAHYEFMAFNSNENKPKAMHSKNKKNPKVKE